MNEQLLFDRNCERDHKHVLLNYDDNGRHIRLGFCWAIC